MTCCSAVTVSLIITLSPPYHLVNTSSPCHSKSTLSGKKLYLLWLILSLSNALFQYLSTLSSWLSDWCTVLVRHLAQFTGMEKALKAEALTAESVLYPSVLLACYMTLVFLRESRAAARMHLCIVLLMCLMFAPFVGLMWGASLPIVAPTVGLLFLYFLHIALPSSTQS